MAWMVEMKFNNFQTPFFCCIAIQHNKVTSNLSSLIQSQEARAL